MDCKKSDRGEPNNSGEKVAGSMEATTTTKVGSHLETLDSTSCSARKGGNSGGKGESQNRTTKGDDKHAISKSTHKQEKSKSRLAATDGQQNNISQPAASSKTSQASGRRGQQKGNNSNHHDASSKSSSAAKDATAAANNARASCSTLEQFSAKAQEIKQDIYDALEKQTQIQVPDEPVEIVQLKNEILKLSLDDDAAAAGENISEEGKKTDSAPISLESESAEPDAVISNKESNDNQAELREDDKSREAELEEHRATAIDGQDISAKEDQEKLDKPVTETITQTEKKSSTATEPNTDIVKTELGSFELLSAKLDQETKYISLVSSLKEDFEGSPEMLEPICKKLVQMSELICKLQSDCENYELENKKLLVIRQKLENLCRELQKSNNAIRIESLDLIKLEQGKAKEQTTKIQSTLSGVIKLFDDNQQRNMALRQENQELQTKLRSLLEHCDSWEKGFATALRQRDIENRLVKTELAKANLLKNEEKERFLKEKQDLLQLLSMMQEHQSRIEGQEAKLRSDLSNYASRYDECQAVISKGMSKFQTESKRMLKQIEKSKQDYKVLLTKYESSNKRMAQLLDEKQRWDRSMNVANKKIETLEKLCRALRDQKAVNSKGVANTKITNDNKKSSKPSSVDSARIDTSSHILVDDSTFASHVDVEKGESATSSTPLAPAGTQESANDDHFGDNDMILLSSGTAETTQST